MSAMPAVRLWLATRLSPTGVAKAQCEVTHLPFNIGRAPNNDWALPDPGRVLSKQHCRITANGETWLITDTSSNGTFVNGAELDPGVPQVLRDGDRLVFGSYEVEALLGHSTQQAGGKRGFGADPAPPSQPADPQRLQPDDGSLFVNRPAGDPFLYLDDDVLEAARPSVSLPTDFDPLTPAEQLSESPYTAPDHVPELAANFRPPRPDLELLPEDWDQDPEQRPAPRASPPATGADNNSFRGADWEDAGTTAPAVRRTAPVHRVPHQVVSGQEACDTGGSDGERGGSPASRLEPLQIVPALAAGHDGQGQAASSDGERPATADRIPRIESSATACGRPSAALDAPGAFGAFAAGAGVARASVAEPGKTLAALGAAFRTVVIGLRRMMIARAAIKAEFRIDQTMIQATGNNPLKFAADDDDALAALLGTGRNGGMRPAQAIGEALRDIRHHELAVAAAMQQAVREMLERLDPARIMRDASPTRLERLTGSDERRAWRRYTARHAEVMGALADDFDSVFGRSFGRAYDVALADIAAQDTESDP